jgi:hypothetical protein
VGGGEKGGEGGQSTRDRNRQTYIAGLEEVCAQGPVPHELFVGLDAQGRGVHLGSHARGPLPRAQQLDRYYLVYRAWRTQNARELIIWFGTSRLH